MRRNNKIDTYSLQEQAKKSEDKEAFAPLARMRNCRVGVGARIECSSKPIFFIEIIANLCSGQDILNLNSLENNVRILRRLGEKGYLLTCEEDGSVLCELTVPSENLAGECKSALFMMRKYGK